MYQQINWNDQLIIIKGQRGVGKTTLLLQYIVSEIENLTEALYISLDDIYFSNNSLSDTVEEFVQNGGKYLFIDEIHRYINWSVELKNIYDFYPELKVVATGSSAIAIHEGEADLSRRASVYQLNTLSLREYVLLFHNIELPVLSINEIIQNHQQISIDFNRKIKPLKLFNEFLEIGSYPFARLNDAIYYDKLKSIVNLIIDNDISSVENITYETRIKLKKLLYLIATTVPFKPNITELSNKVATSRDVLLRHMYLLARSGLINLLSHDGTGASILQKPDKIYINNPTLMYALDERVNRGTLRETFFMNQLSAVHTVTYPKSGDFLVNNQYLFEIGGKNKTNKQIAGINQAYTALDDIEHGLGTKIPLWLFGFLY